LELHFAGALAAEGSLDLPAFLRAAQAVNLSVILRPGPYICAEVDFGGLPSWLLRLPDLEIRSTHPVRHTPAKTATESSVTLYLRHH